jgi:FkbM family methyltransferase
LNHYLFQKYHVLGEDLVLSDREGSIALEIIIKELRADHYNLEKRSFDAGDVVVDIGAHVGSVSIYIAKRWPDITVYAYEPHPTNFDHLQQNIQKNDVHNIVAFRRAVTADRRDVVLTARHNNSGWSTAFSKPDQEDFIGEELCSSVRLEDIFDEHHIETCRFMKMDCEGAEHEVLRSFPYFDRVSFLAGEFHDNAHLKAMGHGAEALLAFCTQKLGAGNLAITFDGC